MKLKESGQTTVSMNGGIGFIGLLQIVFIVLKLCSVINWSWFWVLSPVIFVGGLTVLILIVCLIIGLIASRR